jgi:hypothetical protein
MPNKDEWDARSIPARRRGMSEGRRQGLLIMLVAIGIPLVVFFFQDDGKLRFTSRETVFERTLTPAENQEIRQAVAKHKENLDGLRKTVEEIKEKYRGEIGEGYDREIWVVTTREGLAIPFKYFLALGAILFLVGVGRLIL